MLEIALIVLAVLVLLTVAAGLLAYLRPQTLTPLGKLLLRTKRGQRFAEKQAAKAVAANPELIGEMAGEVVSKKEAEEVERRLAAIPDDERAERLTRTIELAQSGRVAEAQRLLAEKPKTANDKRAAAKRKAKNRAKAKQARKQRKRKRR